MVYMCCGVFFFFIFVLLNVLWDGLRPHTTVNMMSASENEGGTCKNNSQHVKDARSLCLPIKYPTYFIPALFSPHVPKTSFFHPPPLCWQLVERGFGGDLVCHPHPGPVPEGVRHPRGSPERTVLPVPYGGGGRRVRLQHRKRAVCVH